ncbi:MAG TPA: lipopolysaccharide kinase InaA family protein [Isosphaeraceae bacterium]|nr:lipopolysaccharide kinase InaA family protein [Isosphaeraceae bacterium]
MTQLLRDGPATDRMGWDRGEATGPALMFREPEWDWAEAGDGATGWWVRPSWRATLLGPEGLRLEQWRREGRLATIKAGPHRVVYRADLDEGPVFIKHYLVPDFRSKVRQWVRRGKGRNEAKRAVRLAALGIPTITPIALGERRKRKFLLENYLVTPAIPETVPLDEFVQRRLDELPEPRRGRVARALAEALGVLTARLHRHNVVHEDFHPGNLLVRLDDDDRPALAMIDLDALRVRRKLDWPEAQANLALLNHYFWTRSSRSVRRRFLVAYLRARGEGPPDPKGFARGIERATRAWAERLWRRWGRRCRSSNKYFESYRGDRAFAVATRDLDEATIRALLADPDAPFAEDDTRMLKDSRTTTVAEATLDVAGRPTRVIYKRFNRKKWLDPVFCLFRPSRAWQAWQGGQHLASRGLPTPRNLAVLARLGPLGLPRDTYLVTIKAEPAATLDAYLRDVLPALDPDARRRRTRALTRALARLVRTLHERSLSHRDLKAANILVEGDATEAEPRLSLIDLVGVRLKHPLPPGRRLQNLARLHVSLAARSRADSIRFLRDYGLRADWKATWRAVARLGARKVEKNRRSGRELS